MPHAACAIVAVETGRPCATYGLILADALQTVGIGAHRRAVLHFFDYLREASGVHVVFNEILRYNSVDRLRDAVAESVVDHGDSCAARGHRGHVVFGIISVALAAGGQHIAVGVVGLRRNLVVGIISPTAGVDRAEG